MCKEGPAVTQLRMLAELAERTIRNLAPVAQGQITRAVLLVRGRMWTQSRSEPC
jgi:hypothetical protein